MLWHNVRYPYIFLNFSKMIILASSMPFSEESFLIIISRNTKTSLLIYFSMWLVFIRFFCLAFSYIFCWQPNFRSFCCVNFSCLHNFYKVDNYDILLSKTKRMLSHHNNKKNKTKTTKQTNNQQQQNLFNNKLY